MNMKNLLSCVGLALLTIGAKADTLTFNGVPGGGDIGPYSMTLTTGSGSTDLLAFCMNDGRYIQGGESWDVTVVNAADITGPLTSIFKEEAFIYSKYDGTNATAVQLALWKLFDASEDISGNLDAQNLLTAASNTSDPFYTDGALAGITFYLYDYPTQNVGGQITNQYGDYLPQNFVGISQTPEPSSLILMGSGLAGLAGLVRHRFARS